MKKPTLKISKKTLARTVFLTVFIIAGLIASSSDVSAPENTKTTEAVDLPQKVYEAPAPKPSPEPVSKPEPEPEPEPTGQIEVFDPQMPAEGEIIRPFSGNELIYSKTTGDYRTHQGIDISSEILGRVYACDNGTVESITEDELMGISITISHTDGFTSVYSNLSTGKMTQVGQAVTKGQIISGVGDTALMETGEEGHLHFEILKDGTPQNPENYF